MGRPCKLTPQVQASVCRYVEWGVSFKDAALASGVGPRSFFRWTAAGREALARQEAGEELTEEDGVFVGFLEAVAEAEAKFKASMVLTINKASVTSWQSAAWLLERKYPAEFGLRQVMQLDIRQEAARLAEEAGVDVEKVVSEAERLYQLRSG